MYEVCGGNWISPCINLAIHVHKSTWIEIMSIIYRPKKTTFSSFLVIIPSIWAAYDSPQEPVPQLTIKKNIKNTQLSSQWIISLANDSGCERSEPLTSCDKPPSSCRSSAIEAKIRKHKIPTAYILPTPPKTRIFILQFMFVKQVCAFIFHRAHSRIDPAGD